MSPNSFPRHVYAVQRYIEFTAPRYAALLPEQIVTHPICCFGDAQKASVITVGLNPSSGEFSPERRWPEQINHTELADRCCDYFANPHEWFIRWSEALTYLGVDYQNGTAAHMDLSPRATKFVSSLAEQWEQELFLEMVERDLWTFFGTLSLCSNVKLLLIAGSVTGRYYANEFLQRHAPNFGYSLDGAFNRLRITGAGKVAWHVLSGGERAIQVFFCSVSPSARDSQLLPQRVRENIDRLTTCITK